MRGLSSRLSELKRVRTSSRRWKAQVLRLRSTTASSISIADPDGGETSDLKGAIFQRTVFFNAGEGLRAERKSAAADIRRMLVKPHSASTRSLSERTEQRQNQRRHPRPRAGYERGHAVEPPERDAYGRGLRLTITMVLRTVRQPERRVVCIRA